jgi:quinol monooxygenase YgiN
MYGLVVLFTLRPGHESVFDQLTAEMLASIEEREPGTLVYAVHRVEGGGHEARIFYELYRDRAAFEEHERQPHVRRFLSEREQHTIHVRVDRLSLVAGKGVPAVDQP